MAKARQPKQPIKKKEPDTRPIWLKRENLYRVPKDLCPRCNRETKVVKNGYDIIDKGTPEERRIQRYTCKACGKHYRERDYASPKILMARQSVILWLYGWNNKAIAQMLEIDEVSVARYLRRYLKNEKAREIRRSKNEETPETEKVHSILMPFVKMYKEPKK